MTSDRGAESRDGGLDAARGSASHVVLVDGSNVAHSSEGEQPSLADIVAVCDKLRGEGYEPVVVVDAALRHQIDDRAGYERLVDEGHIRQAPARTTSSSPSRASWTRRSCRTTGSGTGRRAFPRRRAG
jgi:hypothetical protein